jgi:primosomal protein N'
MAGLYRWQILLKGEKFRPLLEEHPLNTWQTKNVPAELTVDPPSVL